MPTSLEKIQSLFRELFQFDLCDLDFGIYRLFRLKKDELEKFLGQQIPQSVEKAFADLAEGDTGKLKAEVADLAQKIRDELEVDAILDDGSLNPRYDRNTIGKTVRLMVNDYEEKFKRLRGLLATENQKDDVFNHLHAFFSRYYDRGDFISRRFFGARPRYAVPIPSRKPTDAIEYQEYAPYNGEETHFHWANKDQHYIKSGEAFRDYSFTVADILGGPARVRFALTKASVPPGDTKGDRRYFFPQADESKWDATSRTFTITFHYRLPVEAELKSAPAEENGAAGENGGAAEESGNGANGKAAKTKKISGDKLQEKLLADALDVLVAACPEAGLADALRKVVNQEEVEPDGKPPVTYLAKRMRHFARRQTSDYFVHKNLAAFLREELDFYIKDQVIHVADLEGDFEGKRRMLRALRELAGQIIAFLHQIEEVQRRLFEKRKFVLRTDYLCAVQNVPRALWKEICANKRQLAEWVDLYALGKDGAGDDDLFAFKGKLTESFLENHPTLVVNTALFDDDFKWRLLESFDDLDAVLDGVLVKSENYQALKLVERALYDRLRCIYIDPPYNTGSDDFIYKDRYQRSSWMAMMLPRLVAARQMLTRDGSIFVSIDDNEFTTLREVLDLCMGTENFVASIIWQKVYSPKNSARHFSESHDFVVTYARNAATWKPNLLKRTEEANARYENLDNDPRDVWKPSDISARNFYSEGTYIVTSPSGKKFGPPEGRYWVMDEDSFLELDQDKRVWWGEKGDNMPQEKLFLTEVKQGMIPQTIWTYREVGHTQEAKKQLMARVNFARTEDVLNTVKPPRLIQRIFQLGSATEGECFVADFFGGSGSTADAVIRQNQADGVRRRFLLVEMGQYFDDIILQRVKRSLAFPEWANRVPKRSPTPEEASRTPRLVKVLRLESYEDALHNLATGATLAASQAKAAAFQGALGAESYRLNYIARLPLEASASMLQTARLDHPFRYSLEILTDDGAKERSVDLAETFNWLLGLDVQRVRRWQHEKRDYLAVLGRDRANKRLLIVWRDTADLDPKAERAFLEKQVAALTKDAPFDRMLINGDSATPGFESLDALFKQLMEAE